MKMRPVPLSEWWLLTFDFDDDNDNDDDIDDDDDNDNDDAAALTTDHGENAATAPQ